MKLKIKKDDEVRVISGGERGKTGRVLNISLKPLKIRVAGVFVQNHFDKKERKSIKKEGFIDYSNVRLVQSAEKKTKKRKIEKKSRLSRG